MTQRFRYLKPEGHPTQVYFDCRGMTDKLTNTFHDYINSTPIKISEEGSNSQSVERGEKLYPNITFAVKFKDHDLFNHVVVDYCNEIQGWVICRSLELGAPTIKCEVVIRKSPTIRLEDGYIYFCSRLTVVPVDCQ